MNKNRLRIAVGLLVVFGSFAGFSVGCSSSSNDNDVPTNGGNVSVGGSQGTGGDSTLGGDTSTDVGGSGTDGGAAGTGGASSTDTGITGGANAGGAAGTGGSSGVCVPDATKTCYSCPASTNDQFLNHCTDATCQPFDNTAKGVPAALPAIP